MAKLLAIINSLVYIDINGYILINNYDKPMQKRRSPLYVLLGLREMP